MKRLLILPTCAAALLLAACNSNGTGQNYTNPPVCGLQGTTYLVYPINGAANVPDSTQVVYIVSNNDTLGNGNFNTFIQPPNNLPAYPGNNFVSVPASSVPKPHAHPSVSNPHYYSSNIGGLSAGSTYVIGFNVVNQNCVPAGIGSFTTQ
jgi:hypothetical protein